MGPAHGLDPFGRLRVDVAKDHQHGKGLACAIKDGGGTHTVSQAAVRVHADGSASVHIGSVEMGQGSHTTLGRSSSRSCSFRHDRGGGRPGEYVGYALRSGHEREPHRHIDGRGRTEGGATRARSACGDRRRHCLAAPQMPFGSTMVSLSGPDRELSISEVIGRHFGMPGGEILGVGVVSARGRFPEERQRRRLLGDRCRRRFGCRRSRDRQNCPLGYVSVADVGVAAEPGRRGGPGRGCRHAGLGHVLFEALHYEDGQLLNGNLVEYRVPTFEELPDEFSSVLIEDHDGPGPYGVKGVGESGVISAAPAVANAVFRAAGCACGDLPLTPEAIWRALRARGRMNIGRRLDRTGNPLASPPG